MSYQVGSLSALLKGSCSEGSGEETTLKSLFESRTTTDKKAPAVAPETEEDGKQSLDGEDSEMKAGAVVKKSKKQKQKTVEKETEEESEFKTPSRSFLVKAEASKDKKFDPEKEARTVFVGNLPASVNVKDIKRRFKDYGSVETVRLRGAARPDLKTTKKVAVITRKIHENRNNINAYVRFKDKESALKSCQLNGTDFDSHVIRVDMAMKEGDGSTNQVNGSTGKHHDQSKSIFLGNLHFGIEEDQVRKHFQACGDIIDVRLIRDSFTGIGKGFGYVNFKSSDSIELGLKMNGSSLEGRDVRVSRATNKPKQKIVQKVKPSVKPTFISKRGDGKPGPKTAGGVMNNTKKFIKKPKVEFQGKVGMTRKEIREKKKAVKKAKRVESRKLKAQNKPAK